MRQLPCAPSSNFPFSPVCPMTLPHIYPLTVERHTTRRWQRHTDYRFAARQPLAPLAGFELQKAATCLPIAFLDLGTTWVAAAILGVPPATNLCVTPDGQWTRPYVPAVLRADPFSLHKADSGQWLLCVDEDSGQVSAGAQGEAFYTEDGQLTPALQTLSSLLMQVEQGRQAVQRACVALHQQALLVPWPIKIQTDAGSQAVGGLFRVDEAALGKLPAEALQALMQAGALALAYAQLLSMQHFATLAPQNAPSPQPAQAPQTPQAPQDRPAAAAVAAPAAPAAAPAPGAPGDAVWQVPADLTRALGDLDLDFLSKSDTLRFDKL